MKLKIDQAALSEKLKRATLATGAALNPLHKLVKLEAKKTKEGGELIISSVAGQLALTTSIRAFVEEPGVIATNTKDLANAASAMPSGAIAITFQGPPDKIRLKLTGSSGRNWTAPTADPSQLQRVPEPVGLPCLKLPVEFATQAVERTSFPIASITDEESGWAGIRFEATPTSLRAVGCSRYQFAVYDIATEVEITKSKGVWAAMIAAPALNMFRDLLKEAKDEADEGQTPFVDLHMDSSFVYMVGPSTLAVASLPVAEYPPYENMLTMFAKEPHGVLSRLVLLESLKAALATRSSSSTSSLTSGFFTFAGGSVRLRHEDSDHDFDDTVPTVSMRPELNATIRSSIPLFNECLRYTDEDPQFFFSDTGGHILFRTSVYRAMLVLQDPGSAAGPTERT